MPVTIKFSNKKATYEFPSVCGDALAIGALAARDLLEVALGNGEHTRNVRPLALHRRSLQGAATHHAQAALLKVGEAY